MISTAQDIERVTRLEHLRQQARELRFATSNAELLWDLTQAEALAELVLERCEDADRQLLQTHISYLINLLGAIRERIRI